jgi:hypothetical protein
MKNYISQYSTWINENKEKYPHDLGSESNWRQILKGNDYALKVLDTCFAKQDGKASDRQWEILQRGRRGDRTPYHSKN